MDQYQNKTTDEPISIQISMKTNKSLEKVDMQKSPVTKMDRVTSYFVRYLVTNTEISENNFFKTRK